SQPARPSFHVLVPSRPLYEGAFVSESSDRCRRVRVTWAPLMDQILTYFELHGAPVIFVIVFLDQLGLPIPAVPLLLMLGALAGRGRVDPIVGLVAAVAGSVAADFVWFQLGRWKGTRALALLCKLSLEPDTCVSKTQGLFAR